MTVWRNSLWAAGYILYWAATVAHLRRMLPIYLDGSGPTPTLFWGRPEAPDLGEYYRRQSHYDFIYLVPYLVLALVVTTACYAVAPLLLKRFQRLSSRSSAGTAIVALLLLLALSLSSDAASRLGLGAFPRFIAWGEFSLFQISWTIEFYLVPSLLAGIVEFLQRSLREKLTSAQSRY